MITATKEAATTFGWELILDIKGCNPDTIKSREKLLEFVVQLCDLIEMKRYGEPLAELFGHGRKETLGYTVVQLIETSSIVMHVGEYARTVYLDVFSCKPYDRYKVRDFCLQYFGASSINETYVTRE